METLSPKQLQHALATLVAETDDIAVAAAKNHSRQGKLALKVDLNDQERWNSTETQGIITTRRADNGSLGFDIYPARGIKSGALATALANVFEKELQIKPQITYQRKYFLGLLDDTSGPITIEFQDTPKLRAAVNVHPSSTIQSTIAEIRTQRLTQEAEAERIQIADELARQEAAGLISERHAYESRRKGPAFIDAESPLAAHALCVVHATNFLPRLLADGTAEIDTTTTARNGEVFRNTVHMSLNHKVAGHENGIWENAPFTIIGDFNAAVARNGVPQCLNTVDTWWTRGWQESLQIPNAVIIQPGAPTEGLRQASINGGIYKNRDFSISDILQLRANASSSVNHVLNRHFENGWRDEQAQFWSTLTTFAEKQPEAKLTQTLRDEFGLPPETAAQLEAGLSAVNNKLTVNEVIDQLGYQIYSGGKWAWSDEWGTDSFPVTASTKLLAAQMGTICNNHVNSRQKDIEDGINRTLARLVDGKAPDTSTLKAIAHMLQDDGIDARSKQVAAKIIELKGITLDEPMTPSPSRPSNGAPVKEAARNEK